MGANQPPRVITPSLPNTQAVASLPTHPSQVPNANELIAQARTSLPTIEDFVRSQVVATDAHRTAENTERVLAEGWRNYVAGRAPEEASRNFGALISQMRGRFDTRHVSSAVSRIMQPSTLRTFGYDSTHPGDMTRCSVWLQRMGISSTEINRGLLNNGMSTQQVTTISNNAAREVARLEQAAAVEAQALAQLAQARGVSASTPAYVPSGAAPAFTPAQARTGAIPMGGAPQVTSFTPPRVSDEGTLIMEAPRMPSTPTPGGGAYSTTARSVTTLPQPATAPLDRTLIAEGENFAVQAHTATAQGVSTEAPAVGPMVQAPRAATQPSIVNRALNSLRRNPAAATGATTAGIAGLRTLVTLPGVGKFIAGAALGFGATELGFRGADSLRQNGHENMGDAVAIGGCALTMIGGTYIAARGDAPLGAGMVVGAVVNAARH